MFKDDKKNKIVLVYLIFYLSAIFHHAGPVQLQVGLNGDLWGLFNHSPKQSTLY